MIITIFSLKKMEEIAEGLLFYRIPSAPKPCYNAFWAPISAEGLPQKSRPSAKGGQTFRREGKPAGQLSWRRG